MLARALNTICGVDEKLAESSAIDVLLKEKRVLGRQKNLLNRRMLRNGWMNTE